MSFRVRVLAAIRFGVPMLREKHLVLLRRMLHGNANSDCCDNSALNIDRLFLLLVWVQVPYDIASCVWFCGL